MECCKHVDDRHFSPLFFRAINAIRRVVSPAGRAVRPYVREGFTVADLGSGPGYFTAYLSRLAGTSGKVISVDSDPRMIRYLERFVSRKRLENVTCRVASATDVGFIPDSSVDFVLSSGTICCLLDHDRAVSEIIRILKDTGTAIIAVGKHLPASDPRTVSKEEWNRILSRFNVAENIETHLELRAVVSKKK